MAETQVRVYRNLDELADSEDVPDVYDCSECGGMVISREKHDEWHATLAHAVKMAEGDWHPAGKPHH